ncbi:hypothetical protein CAPTEDRAFT_188004 [Capitella teleta]|uniref:Uncharacterized protein n=1 Tax=Capitella teleta TaxID=283909 RepID=R7UUR6_CAPTE|nr:hypothetical protein CAPTEDRAFT_188004 [Capitella teleta]|eukprot:ELU10383.1 hypothetical protein CAPTEDRAFT_188004 [Capitella teleta]
MTTILGTVSSTPVHLGLSTTAPLLGVGQQENAAVNVKDDDTFPFTEVAIVRTSAHSIPFITSSPPPVAEKAPNSSLDFVKDNIGAVIGGVLAGAIIVAVSIAAFLVIKRKSKESSPSTKLVQCHLLEPHLRRNPLYVQQQQHQAQGPYQISTLQHHYERISSLNRKTPPGASKYFYSIPNKKRTRGLMRVAKPAIPEDIPRKHPSPYPPQRAKSLELPPIPSDSEVSTSDDSIQRHSWAPSSTFSRSSTPAVTSPSARENANIYETLSEKDLCQQSSSDQHESRTIP